MNALPTAVLAPADVDRVVTSVQGWLGPHEGRLLYRLAADADPRGCIVEIGSWHGRSTIWLAAGSAAGRGADVVAIDPHRGTRLRADDESTEEILRANLEQAGVEDRVQVLVATSEDAARGWSLPVSLLWIDGDHSYESALRDLDLWEPFLLPHATVALHDTFVMDGPERVVQERLVRPGCYSRFLHADTTTAARRCVQPTRLEAVRRRASLTRRTLYGVRLRAYDSNVLGYAHLWDRLARR
jgi:predicted O-methyltransferase YrrM